MFVVGRSSAEEIIFEVQNLLKMPGNKFEISKTLEEFLDVEWLITIEFEPKKTFFLTMTQKSETRECLITDLNVYMRNWLVEENSLRPYEVIRAFPRSYTSIEREQITKWDSSKTKKFIKKGLSKFKLEISLTCFPKSKPRISRV